MEFCAEPDYYHCHSDCFSLCFKGLKYLKNEIKNEELKIPGFYADWANPTYQIIRVLVFAFMIVVIFPYLPGTNSPVFRGVSVFLGFLFTFGSAGSLSNIISGLILTYMRLFKIGDRVKIGEQVGDVIEKSLLVTRIRTIKNEIISIPNSTVMNSHTINYSSDAPGTWSDHQYYVTIGYDTPWREMHEALIEAALRTEFGFERSKAICTADRFTGFLCFLSNQCIHPRIQQTGNHLFCPLSKYPGCV